MNQSELAKKIFEVSHLKGSFLLRSGKTSTEYFDKYQFESDPVLLSEIAKQLAPKVPKDTDLLAGLEMGGIPLAVALSFQTGIPIVFVRKQPKTYGTLKWAEGPSIKGKTLCLIEDVITTGGQAKMSALDLRREGAIIHHALCVILRNETEVNPLQEVHIELSQLFSMSELLRDTEG